MYLFIFTFHIISSYTHLHYKVAIDDALKHNSSFVIGDAKKLCKNIKYGFKKITKSNLRWYYKKALSF
jgi:hypothetical protein